MNAAAAAAAATAPTNPKGPAPPPPNNDSAPAPCVNGRTNGEVKTMAEPKTYVVNDIATPVNDVRVIYTNVNHFDSANNRLSDVAEKRDSTLSECSTLALTDDGQSDRLSVQSDKSACHDTTDNTNNNKMVKNANAPGIDEDIVVLRRAPTSPKDSSKVFIVHFSIACYLFRFFYFFGDFSSDFPSVFLTILSLFGMRKLNHFLASFD